MNTYITRNNIYESVKILLTFTDVANKEKCLIYFPDVSPWRFKISAVFPAMLQLNDGGQQGSFLCPYMILIILRAEGVQFPS